MKAHEMRAQETGWAPKSSRVLCFFVLEASFMYTHESKGNKRGFKPLPCHLETPLRDICYNNLSLRLSFMRYRNIKFLHIKINENS